jgi:predicted DNA-binding protein
LHAPALLQFLVALPTSTVERLDAIASETMVPRVALVRSAIDAFLLSVEKRNSTSSSPMNCDAT